MRNISLLLLILVICLASAQTSLKPAADTRTCSAKEKLPGACTFIYQPVCGVYVNEHGQQVKKTYGNRCAACKSSKVQYVFPGECTNYPKNSKFCFPVNPAVTLCPNIYQPVCGYFGQNIQCLVPPCATTGSNSCLVCFNPNVVYYLPGVCPTFGNKN